jgi:hypothetical protein
VQERLLDEVQLSILLRSPRQCDDVFLVQMYLPPVEYSGCGHISHEYMLDSRRIVSRISYELSGPQRLRGEGCGSPEHYKSSGRLMRDEDLAAVVAARSAVLVNALETQHPEYCISRGIFSFVLSVGCAPVLVGVERLTVVDRIHIAVPSISALIPDKAKVGIKPTKSEILLTEELVKPVEMATSNSERRAARLRPRSAGLLSRLNVAVDNYNRLTESRRAKSDVFLDLPDVEPMDEESYRPRPSSAPLGRRFRTYTT